jgi:phenylacetate-CoA ligase
VEVEKIRGLEDLSQLPFTTKAELSAAQAEHPPYGDLPTFPLDRYRYLHRTSGTSGRPLLWLDTEDDWATWIRCWGHVYRGAGVGPGDIVLGAFSYGPYVAHWSAMAGAREVGALGIAGGGMSSLQRLEMIRDHGVTVLVSTPTYALHLGEVAAQEGFDLAASTVRVTIHAGEPGASVPNVKRRLEEIWGARCFDHAGATEVGAWGFPCQAPELGMHLNELELLFEVVEPGGGIEVADGERGELVITSLGRSGMPVVRYRTGDLVVRTQEPCACGRTLARIPGGVLGRADDMLVVRGVNLFPSAVDDLLRGVPGVAEYEVEIRRKEGMDDLLLKLEAAPEKSFLEVEKEVSQTLRSALNLRVKVQEAATGSLPRYELKARRFKRISG